MTKAYKIFTRNHIARIERAKPEYAKKWLVERAIPFFNVHKDDFTEEERVDISDYIANIKRDLS